MITEVIYLRWFDSSILPNLEQGEDVPGVCENESAGLLVAEDESTVTIALDRCRDTGRHRLLLCVPRVNIRSIERFRPGA